MADEKSEKSKIWDELRKPFPAEVIGKIARGNTELDFVGHAAVTDRLNNVLGPDGWNWEPVSLDEFGLPQLDAKGNLWIKLLIRDDYRSTSDKPVWVARLGYGDGSSSIKELIGDAIRNAGMRFGIALDLWSKDELESTMNRPDQKNRPAVGSAPAPAKPVQIRMIVDAMRAQGVLDEAMGDELVEKYGVRDAHKMTEPEAARVIKALGANL